MKLLPLSTALALLLLKKQYFRVTHRMDASLDGSYFEIPSNGELAVA
jgi:hypothetical protein